MIATACASAVLSVMLLWVATLYGLHYPLEIMLRWLQVSPLPDACRWRC